MREPTEIPTAPQTPELPEATVTAVARPPSGAPRAAPARPASAGRGRGGRASPPQRQRSARGAARPSGAAAKPARPPSATGKQRSGPQSAATTQRTNSGAKLPELNMIKLRQASPTARRKMVRRALYLLSLAEDAARAKMEHDADVAFAAVMQEISDLSFGPHRRAILLLHQELTRLTEDCCSRALHAENSAASVLQETTRMVDAVHDAGERMLKDSGILDANVAFTEDEMVAEGVIRDCAKTPSSRLTEPHLTVREWSSSEKPGIEWIRKQFLDFYTPLEDSEASGVHSTKRVEGVCDATRDVTTAVMCLLGHTHQQLRRSWAMIEEQQRALDDATTRAKLADDILQGTVNKDHVEVDSAIQLCRQFGMELRQRMDSIEKEMRETLSELIDRSTEVSMANNAFHDHAQLLINKDNTMQWYMTKMETVTVEQGKLLLDVRLRLLKLWKERSRNGDEARANITHSGLPKCYHDMLEFCDHDTLVRLLHYVTLNNADASALLISALDEHEHFLATNTAEANAVAESGKMQRAVVALLQKLWEENEIKINPRPGPNFSLADTILDMVRQYDAYMNAGPRRAHRAARRAGRPSYPFFDPRTPVPKEFAADIAAHASSGAPRAKSPFAVSSLPRLAVPRVLSELRRSCPSTLDPPGTATVVGYGRWGGLCAQRPDAEPKPEPQQTPEAAPPPRVPPRVALIRHVLQSHAQDHEGKCAKAQEGGSCFPGEDAPLLKMQRELIQSTEE